MTSWATLASCSLDRASADPCWKFSPTIWTSGDCDTSRESSLSPSRSLTGLAFSPKRSLTDVGLVFAADEVDGGAAAVSASGLELFSRAPVAAVASCVEVDAAADFAGVDEVEARGGGGTPFGAGQAGDAVAAGGAVDVDAVGLVAGADSR